MAGNLSILNFVLHKNAVIRVQLQRPNDRMLKKVLVCIYLLSFIFSLQAQDRKTLWVDSVFQTLNSKEKIGQLFMLPVSAYATEEEIEDLEDKIKSYDVGGLMIVGGGPVSVANTLNKLQRISYVPLLVGIHAEWGLGQSLDSTMSFQKPLLLGSISDNRLITALGREIGKEMKTLGLHINFAPQADISINGNDPFLYFGDHKKRVADRSLAFMHGLQGEGILVCAKHLPYPKEDDIKSGTALQFEVNRLDTLEFYPYQKLIEGRIDGMLTSHLHFSSLEKNQTIPASMSQIFISEILRRKMDFIGLTFTEIPYLQTLTNKTDDGETELLAFIVGNDVLIAPQDMKAAVNKINKAVRRNDKLMQQLDASVRKILEAKFNAGLHEYRHINTDNLIRQLYSTEAVSLSNRLSEAAVTVVRNSSSTLPVKILENKRFASITIGREEQNEFNVYLSRYVPFQNIAIRTASDTLNIEKKIQSSDVLVIGLYPLSASFQKDIIHLIKKWDTQKEVILCLFTNPQYLHEFEGLSTIIEAYTDEYLMPQKTAQVIFGGLPATATLPLASGNSFHEGDGTSISAIDRLSYGIPESVGMDSKVLDQIKTIAKEAIDMGATPGCQVLVARKGKVVYQQSFGWLTYENKIPVSDETIYDLASLTKVSATLQTAMFMQEKGLLDLNKKVSVYLPELKNTNKKDITIIDLLTHQSGLVPFMMLWPLTVKDSIYLPHYYGSVRNENYSLQVAPNLFANNNIRDSVWTWIVKSKMLDRPPRTPFDYRYSDLGFMILKQLSEKILNQPMDDFLHQNLYEPLGAFTTGFNPLDNFDAQKIAPTEDDKFYRKSTVKGTVHDERAAMMGGVSGHAGLFSTANDLAKLGQMLAQNGHYGGHTYYKPQTVELFSSKQFEKSRRGLGWDKPVQGDWNSPTSMYASSRTYGHTGF
ncbi:MAG: serine hydrolase, partial [Bacteroidia bacterium]|nr:serine hydrolase [Bacteroidia bacterium]